MERSEVTNNSAMSDKRRKLMFNTILVPTDGSPLSEKASNAAVDFAAENGSRIVALSVAEPYMGPLLSEGSVAAPMDLEKYNESVQRLARLYVEKIAHRARAKDVPCKTSVALAFNPHEEIVKAVKTFHCDVVFMATHGRKGLDKLFAGSETQKVLAHSTIPVMVFR
jgi:nucleotide-binding universal stress UspA family protein